MKTIAMRIAILFGAMSLLSLSIASPPLIQGSEPRPVTSPEDITGGNYPPEHYVVLPVPRGGLRAVNKTPLLHKDVLDEDGKTLGKLEQLIIDTKSGKIAYAVISLEDGRLVPLPWSELKTTRNKTAVVVSSTQPRLETAIGLTAKEIRTLMRPGMLSEAHTITGEVLKIVGGDYVIKDPSGERVRFHVENGTRINRAPNVGDKIEATVNEFDTAISIKSHAAVPH
jgi:sporulation protein YlmC with PRC-barrel domain